MSEPERRPPMTAEQAKAIRAVLIASFFREWVEQYGALPPFPAAAATVTPTPRRRRLRIRRPDLGANTHERDES